MTLNYNIKIERELRKNKVKQVFHALFPLVFIVLFPKSILGVLFASFYIGFSGYVYLKRIELGYKKEMYETYIAVSLFTLIILALHTNAI